MARKKLKPGTHFVNIKGKRRKVRVLKNGQWRFMKMPSRTQTRKRQTKRGKKLYRKSNPRRSRAKKVYKTAKGKFFKNLGMVGFAEDLAWGYIGMSVLGASASGLATTRVIQGIQGHALGRRGKQRLIYGLIDLIDLWLMGQYKLPSLGNFKLLEQWQ